MIPDVKDHTAEIRDLCIRFGVARLEVFGSAATGRFVEESSDIDLLVEFANSDRPGYADRYFGLLEALQQLLGRDVDLVVASAIKNPFFRESVERARSLLYAA